MARPRLNISCICLSQNSLNGKMNFDIFLFTLAGVYAREKYIFSDADFHVQVNEF
jgi:hypothetical protein